MTDGNRTRSFSDNIQYLSGIIKDTSTTPTAVLPIHGHYRLALRTCFQLTNNQTNAILLTPEDLKLYVILFLSAINDNQYHIADIMSEPREFFTIIQKEDTTGYQGWENLQSLHANDIETLLENAYRWTNGSKYGAVRERLDFREFRQHWTDVVELRKQPCFWTTIDSTMLHTPEARTLINVASVLRGEAPITLLTPPKTLRYPLSSIILGPTTATTIVQVKLFFSPFFSSRCPLFLILIQFEALKSIQERN